MSEKIDALLFVSFGGPEGPDDVLPFLQNVLRGKNVPEKRMLEVAEHYQHFGGVSPINDQNRKLIEALKQEFAQHQVDLPIYWGNRNWHPMLPDTMKQMADDGIKNALAFVTSAFSCYSGCRQYREDIERAQAAVGPNAPAVGKLRVFYNHPGFIEPVTENIESALQSIDATADSATVLFTAHSIPKAMADGCDYEKQLQESCRIITEKMQLKNWQLVYQSRSGPPHQPWLEPDVCDAIQAIHDSDSPSDKLVVVPLGFISDHMEVLFDLDTEAKDLCTSLGISMARAATVGTHPQFVTAIRQLVQERMTDNPVRLALGCLGPNHDVCPTDCCFSGRPQVRDGQPTGQN